jgi:CRISPR-associated protein Csd1
MILQALNDYYHRKMADPDPARRLPVFGREDKQIPFILELTPDGRLAGITDTRTGSGKTRAATRFLVPQGVKKTSGVAANLLWDTAEYALGTSDPKKLAQAEGKGKAHDYAARVRDMQAAFVARIDALPAAVREDDGIRAVKAFIADAPADKLSAHLAGAEIVETNPVVSFRLVDNNDLVCQRPAVSAAAAPPRVDDENAQQEPGPSYGICLVTGEFAPIERLHTAIKGVWGAQSSGANIVSFNLDAFNSWGKQQGGNAPISQAAAFAYTTALNHLLDRNSRQRMQVGDASTVFWAQRRDDSDMEGWFAELFKASDDPDAHTERIRALLDAVHSGRFDGGQGDARFFVLGLAPNAARIAVRFWHDATVSEIAMRAREWFDDLRIARGPNDPEFPALFPLLLSSAVLHKADNIAPELGGDVMRSVLDGTPLPVTLMQAVVQRCRADQAKKTDTGKPVANVSYHRAALLKAGINRLIKHRQFAGKEITVSLDLQNTEPAYLFGRLFSTYERVQADAARRDLNRSVRDTYFGAAMSNPASVFPRLIQLNQHHMRDLRRDNPGRHKFCDRVLGEIWDKLDASARWPATQSLAQRAVFALGYYHQRQAFFTKANSDAAADTTIHQGGN